MAFSLQLVFSKLFEDHGIFHLRDVLHLPDLEHPVIPSHLFFFSILEIGLWSRTSTLSHFLIFLVFGHTAQQTGS